MTVPTLTRRELLVRTAAVAAMHGPLLSARAESKDVAPVRFKRVELGTQPLDAMREFYGSTMGFPIEDDRDDRFTMRAGDSVIEFIQAAEGQKPFNHFAFSIAENKLPSAFEWLSERTTVLTNPQTNEQVMHFKNWNAHAIYWLDPAGNIGEFIAHHSLPTAKPGDFSLDDVLYQSEIGIVVDDVREASAELWPLLGMEPEKRVSRNFSAIGDARGYFIVVPQGRIWLMTDLNAEAHSVHAILESRIEGEAKLDCGPYTLDRVLKS